MNVTDISQRLRNIDKRNIPVYWTLALSLASMAMGGIFIARYYYLDLYNIVLFLLGGSFLALGIQVFRMKTRTRTVTTFFLFGGSAVLLSLMVAGVPASFNLEPVNVIISRDLLYSVLLFFYGLVGAALSMAPLYDFTAHAGQSAAYMLLVMAIIFVLYPLAIIVGQIILTGAPAISWDFLTQDVRNLGAEGGVFPAIIGTLLLMFLTAAISLPLGIGSAIYLQEYVQQGIGVRIIKTSINMLRGTPSIVFGLFGYAVFVPVFGLSLLSASLVLGFYALPMVIRASEEALKSIPKDLRDGSLALGATKWETIRKVVLPPASPGVITGAILGIGEASGETAPILFTGAVYLGAGVPRTLFQPFQALPYHLYEIAGLIGYKDVLANAWGTALILLAIVLGMNVVAIIIRERFRTEL